MKRLKLLLKENLSLPTEESVFEFLSAERPTRYTVERFDGRVAIYLKNESDLNDFEHRFPGLVDDIRHVY
ncbi:hypothetical protein [Parvibaculum sp.]|uniref:hypothetical protein n=1 Tax=Parvibaculum sp. TaxID=2024848 RepID=UPI00391B7027